MDNKTLQSLISNQLYSGAMYNYLVGLADNQECRNLLLSFQKLCQYIMSTRNQHNDLLTHMYLDN